MRSNDQYWKMRITHKKDSVYMCVCVCVYIYTCMYVCILPEHAWLGHRDYHQEEAYEGRDKALVSPLLGGS